MITYERIHNKLRISGASGERKAVALTEHWKVLAGLCFDYLQQIRHDYIAANINLDRSDRAWSPRVGLMYEPLDWLTIYGSTCAWTRTRLYGGIAPKWMLYAGYAYLDGTVGGSAQAAGAGLSVSSNTPGLMPRHSVNLWLRRDLPYGFYAAGGLQFQSARYTSASDLVTLPSFSVFNLGAGYRSKRVDVTLTLDNIFNRRYFISAHGNADLHNMPGESRTLTAAVKWHMQSSCGRVLKAATISALRFKLTPALQFDETRSKDRIEKLAQGIRHGWVSGESK
ncbi:TonB-dependent receptor domain-containing protein [Paraburkholderia bannensis]|uniref:TonB-dependent receptor domain-containing protein n=1 Tax=Paraburkholderia bannensis TaxID=765414 RepID=UPI002AC36623|nr:TonB-dependent receptor [Paraburkholderia bannensis]